MTLWHQGIFFCSKIRKYARHFTLPALRKEEGDERRIAAIFQTEHRAETRNGHRNDNRIDVVDLIAYTTYLEQEINAQRYYHKTQERGEVYLRTADNLLHRQLSCFLRLFWVPLLPPSW